MIDMSIKVQEGKHHKLSNHGLIKLTLEYSLQNLIFPIAWRTFADMQVDGAIQVIEYEKSPSASEGEGETKNEHEEEIEEENEGEIEEETKE